ncbi:hypothetical protein KW516_18965 [Vibrio fluvialis]|nr:hypothetical protein [Vibrio fluvialis]
MKFHIDIGWQTFKDKSSKQRAIAFHVWMYVGRFAAHTQPAKIGATLAVRIDDEGKPHALFSSSDAPRFCAELHTDADREWLKTRVAKWRYGLPSVSFAVMEEFSYVPDPSPDELRDLSVTSLRFDTADDSARFISTAFNSVAELFLTKEIDSLKKELDLPMSTVMHILGDVVGRSLGGHVHDIADTEFPYSKSYSSYEYPDSRDPAKFFEYRSEEETRRMLFGDFAPSEGTERVLTKSTKEYGYSGRFVMTDSSEVSMEELDKELGDLVSGSRLINEDQWGLF